MQRSWLAYISAGLGGAALLGVLCFHFPTLLTSREFRAVYSRKTSRANCCCSALVAAFVLGTVAVLRGADRRVALVRRVQRRAGGVPGGATVRFQPITLRTPYSLGLDWFVISLFFSALVFIPIERMLGVRELSPLRPEWRTDLVYFFVSHVLVQFVLIAVTASTSTVDALVASPALKALVQSLAGVAAVPGAPCCWPTWRRPRCTASTTRCRRSGASMPCTIPAGTWTGWPARACISSKCCSPAAPCCCRWC